MEGTAIAKGADGKKPLNKMKNYSPMEASDKKGIDFKGIGDAIGTYGSDIANLATRTPGPKMGTPIQSIDSPLHDNKNELADIERSYRGAVGGLNQSSQNTDAARASIFAKKTQAQNTSNANLNTINAQIKGKNADKATQVAATNAKKQDIYNEQVLGKELSDIENRSQALATMSNKYIEGENQKDLAQLDRDKMSVMSKYNQDSGTSNRAYMDNLFDKWKDEQKPVARHGGLLKRNRKRKAV